MHLWFALHVPAALKFPEVFGTRSVRALQATTPRPARSHQALLKCSVSELRCLLSLGLNLCCRSARGDPTAHELDAIATHLLLADDDIMPVKSRESLSAGVRIKATALLKCGLVQARGVGCKYSQ